MFLLRLTILLFVMTIWIKKKYSRKEGLEFISAEAKRAWTFVVQHKTHRPSPSQRRIRPSPHGRAYSPCAYSLRAYSLHAYSLRAVYKHSVDEEIQPFKLSRNAF